MNAVESVNSLEFDTPPALRDRGGSGLYRQGKRGLIHATVEESGAKRALVTTNSAEAPPSWELVRKILAEALQIPAEARGVFLDTACAGKQSLRSEVESLIEASAQSALIDHPVLSVAGAFEAEAGPTAEDAGGAAGHRISHYEIIGKLGAGGMGTVYEAVDSSLGRRVALKVISGSSVSDEDKRRFAREAKAASALNDPNIITIYEYGSDAGVDFIAMEYVDGLPLSKLPDQPRPVLLDYARQIALALAHAHRAGIVHRDLKPGNIMVRSSDNLVKVLDFGLARLEDTGSGARPEDTTALTRVGAVLGTPAYMSPEQATGDAVDYRSDIFLSASFFMK